MLGLDTWTAIEPTPQSKLIAIDAPLVIKEPGADHAKTEKLAYETKSFASMDFSLYKCCICGQIVMGFDQENRTRKTHKGRDPVYVKL